MNNANIRYDKEFKVGPVDPRMRGSFIEHIGRCVYNGIYEPDHPTADQYGFREDVKELIRELGVSVIRYPGGNFVSGYCWKDGIGPKEQRPVRKDMAWNSIETNQVGTDEFAAYCKDLGVELMMAVNLGTGTPLEAGELVDYCNTESDTSHSEMRIKYGDTQPYNIKLWCLGNEMDGAWQIAALNAHDYAKKAKETAKIIKWMDKTTTTVACGTCTNEEGHLTFGDWDRIVLESAYDEIDFLSLHRYYNYHPDKQLFYKMTDDIHDIPYFFKNLDEYIKTVVSACDFVKGKLRKQKEIYISFDEWNVITRTGAIPNGQAQHFTYANFSQLDAVVVGGLICTLLNHCDRVKIACQSLLVNEGGMISTQPMGKAIRQTTYYPFRDFAHNANGYVLMSISDLPKQETTHHGHLANLVHCATYDDQNKKLFIMIANCDLEHDCDISLNFTSFGKLANPKWTQLFSEDHHNSNTFENEYFVVPCTREDIEIDGGHVRMTVKNHSWNTITLDTEV